MTTTTQSERDLRALAEELDGKVRAIASILRISSMAIGWYARIMREHHLFAMLGFDSEESYRDELAISEPTWYRHLQIAEGYKRLDKDTYLKMQPTKAYQMLDLPESERTQPEWVGLAADPSITAKEMTYRIQAHLQRAFVKDATCRQDRAWLRIRMDAKAKRVVEEVLDNFCRDQGLDGDRGRALELLIVDADTVGAALAKVISDRLEEFKAIVELLKQAGRPAEERCAAFEKFASRLLVELGQASIAGGLSI